MAGTTRTVKARVAVDGEAEYKQAISDLNTANKTLKAEMQLLQSQYQGNAESTEYLKDKGELLRRELSNQQEKVKVLKEQLALTAERTGDTSAETMKMMQALYKAEAAENDLKAAIEENDAAMEDEGETMSGLGDTVGSLADKFGITLPDGVKEALNGIDGFSTASVAKLAAVSAAVAAVIKVFKELNDLTLEAASRVDDLLTQSSITGVSTEMLQVWDYAAELIDVDADTITGAMTRITKAMGEANSGSQEAANSFSSLGVNIRDETTGNLRSAEDVFYDVVDALGELDAGAERDSIAMSLMGKSAQELNPLINAGSSALKGYAEEAEACGYILEKYQIERLEEVDDAYHTMENTIEAVKNQIAADFAPASKSAMETFSSAVKTAGEWLERSGLIENLASILSSLFSMIDTIGDLISNLPGFGTALDGVNVFLRTTATLVATIADAADAVESLLTGNWNGFKTAMGWNLSSGEMSNSQRVYYSGSEYGSYRYDSAAGGWVGNAGGTDNWRGGLTWVGEAGPELVSLPAGSQIYSAQESRNMGGDTYYITIDAASVKEFNDIVELAQSARQRSRMR